MHRFSHSAVFRTSLRYISKLKKHSLNDAKLKQRLLPFRIFALSGLVLLLLYLLMIIIFIMIIIFSLPERECKGARLTCWVPHHEGSQWLPHQDWHCQLPETWVREHRQKWSMRLLTLRLFVSHWSYHFWSMVIWLLKRELVKAQSKWMWTPWISAKSGPWEVCTTWLTLYIMQGQCLNSKTDHRGRELSSNLRFHFSFPYRAEGCFTLTRILARFWPFFLTNV